MNRCYQEMCRNWAGDGGCPCQVLDLEPDIAEDQDIVDEDEPC